MGRTPKYKPQKVFGRHKHRCAKRASVYWQGVKKCLREGTIQSCTEAFDYNNDTIIRLSHYIRESRFRQKKEKAAELIQWEKDAQANLQWMKRRGNFLSNKIYYMASAEKMRNEKGLAWATTQGNPAGKANPAVEQETGPASMEDGRALDQLDEEADESPLAGDVNYAALGKDSPAPSIEHSDVQLPSFPESSAAGSNGFAEAAEAGAQAAVDEVEASSHDDPGLALLNSADKPQSNYSSASSASMMDEPETDYETISPQLGRESRSPSLGPSSVAEDVEGPTPTESGPAEADTGNEKESQLSRRRPSSSVESLAGPSNAKAVRAYAKATTGDEYSPASSPAFREESDEYEPLSPQPGPDPRPPRFWEAFEEVASVFWPAHTAPSLAAAEALGCMAYYNLPPGMPRRLRDLANEWGVTGEPIAAIREIVAGIRQPPVDWLGQHVPPADMSPLGPGRTLLAGHSNLNGRSFSSATPLPSVAIRALAETSTSVQLRPVMTSGLCPRALTLPETAPGEEMKAALDSGAEAHANTSTSPLISGDRRGPFWEAFEEMANSYWPLHVWPAQEAARTIAYGEPLPHGAASALRGLTSEFAITGDPEEAIREILLGHKPAPGSWEWPDPAY